MEKFSKQKRRGVNAQVIAEKCGCTSSQVYKIWDGETGKWKTDLYKRVVFLTKKVIESYNLPQS